MAYHFSLLNHFWPAALCIAIPIYHNRIFFLTKGRFNFYLTLKINTYNLYIYFYLQPGYLERLKNIRTILQESHFFKTHELIGSSLLFVHDKRKASVWMIDFAKTVPVPEDVNIDHNTAWKVGNHEDGYLIGLNNLISIFESLLKDANGNIEQYNKDTSKSVRQDNLET